MIEPVHPMRRETNPLFLRFDMNPYFELTSTFVVTVKAVRVAR